MILKFYAIGDHMSIIFNTFLHNVRFDITIFKDMTKNQTGLYVIFMSQEKTVSLIQSTTGIFTLFCSFIFSKGVPV